MSIVRIDPEGRRNAEHIAIIIVVDLVPIQSHFRSRRPQAQQPLYQDGHRPSFMMLQKSRSLVCKNQAFIIWQKQSFIIMHSFLTPPWGLGVSAYY